MKNRLSLTSKKKRRKPKWTIVGKQSITHFIQTSSANIFPAIRQMTLKISTVSFAIAPFMHMGINAGARLNILKMVLRTVRNACYRISVPIIRRL